MSFRYRSQSVVRVPGLDSWQLFDTRVAESYLPAMVATQALLDATTADHARRVAAAAGAPGIEVLRGLRSELASAAEHATATYERGVFEGLLGVVDATLEAVDAGRGLAPQSAPLEPGSPAARMLLEIAGGVRGANADLADRLDTDHWQVSRAGRRLRELGLATRSRAGRLNGWALTSAGERQVARWNPPTPPGQRISRRRR